MKETIKFEVEVEITYVTKKFRKISKNFAKEAICFINNDFYSYGIRVLTAKEIK
jgi:hypothetical protein